MKLLNNPKFHIVAKTAGKTLFFPIKSRKKLDAWMRECAPLVNEEIQIYENTGLGYVLMYSETKRKVGF